MTRRRLVAILVLIVAAGGIGVAIAYDQFLRGDGAARLALPSSGPSVSAGTDASPSAGTDATPAADLTAAAAVGEWTVSHGEAGYRVRERLANLSAESDAVGRTTDVSGTATLASAGSSVQLTAASITVDTTTITSDEDRRDDRMRGQGLETDRFPTAGFVLTDPVDIPSSAFDGEIVAVTLRGDLTLHGVTRSVEIDASAQVSGASISVQGEVGFPLSDYEIVAPNVGGFIISIADTGTLEFVVTLARD